MLPSDKDDKLRKLTNMYVTETHEMYFATYSKSEYKIYRATEVLSDLINPSLIEDTS